MIAIITDATIGEGVCVEVDCAAPDRELLLVDWLNRLVFEMATRRLLFGRFSVTIRETDAGYALQGRAWGEPVDRTRHRPAVEVKGATLTALDVHRAPSGSWVARCVVDV
jgi:SHS2 domain-containing protein